jgi:uncharacterized membrane protein
MITNVCVFFFKTIDPEKSVCVVTGLPAKYVLATTFYPIFVSILLLLFIRLLSLLIVMRSHVFRYKDPKTGLPYATLEAFKIIRERYHLRNLLRVVFLKFNPIFHCYLWHSNLLCYQFTPTLCGLAAIVNH